MAHSIKKSAAMAFGFINSEYSNDAYIIVLMQMHRVKVKPDWDYVNEPERNSWQKMAAATNGMATPGNMITLLALALVLAGSVLLLDRIYIVGFVMIAIGRALDFVDGTVAERTKTKGPLGEALDSTADKLAFLVVFAVFITESIMPIALLVGLLLLQLANSVVVIAKKLRGINVHTTRYGKIEAAMLWVTIGVFSVSFLLDRYDATPLLDAAVWVLAIVLYLVTITLGLLTTRSYIQFNGKKLTSKKSLKGQYSSGAQK